MIYFAILAYLLILMIMYDFKKVRNGRKFHFFMLLIIFICLAGFRYRLGVDTIRYERFFDQIPTFSQLKPSDFATSKYDPLYLIMAVFAKTLNSEFWTLQLIQAAFVNIVVFRFFYKNTSYLFFSLLMYFFLFYIGYMTETMRESCAISMLLIGWEYYKKDKLLPVFGCLILAFLFHSSAILLFAVFALILLKLDRQIHFSFNIFLIGVVILFAGSFFQNLLINNIELIAFTARISDKIDFYSGGFGFGSKLNILGAIGNVLLYAIIPYICILTLRERKYAQKLEFFVVIEMIFAMISVPIYIFYRYVGYFLPFVVVAMSNALAERALKVPFIGKMRTNTLLAWFLIVAPISFNTIGVMNNNVKGTSLKNYSKFYPYSSIFSKEIDPEREALFSLFIL